jgi:hypothetical protein
MTGAGEDVINILNTSGMFLADAGDDADTANIRAIGAETVIDLGAGTTPQPCRPMRLPQARSTGLRRL